MTKHEFEKRYAEKSGLTVMELRALGITIESCDCDDEICKGWKAVDNQRTETVMKKIMVKVICGCGYETQRVFLTNGYGYFEIPQAYCPDCFNILSFISKELPEDVG